MKTCTKCKIEKPFEAFYKCKARKDGYLSECKECQKSRKKELKKSPLMQLERQIRSSIKLENKLLTKEGKRLCSKCNEIFLIDDLNGKYCKNCKIEHMKEYYEKNKDNIKEKSKEYKEKNKDNIKENQKGYWKEYRDKNRDKIKEHRENNKEHYKEYYKEYYLKKKLEKENKTEVTS